MSKGFYFSFVGASLVGALLLAAGCGGGGGSAPPTKEAFVREGNAICVKMDQEREEVLKAAVKLAGQHPSPKEQEEYILDLLPSYETAAAKLDELEPPAGDEKKIQAIVKAMEESAEAVKASPGTALVSAVQFKKANELAAAYGLDKCTS